MYEVLSVPLQSGIHLIVDSMNWLVLELLEAGWVGYWNQLVLERGVEVSLEAGWVAGNCRNQQEGGMEQSLEAGLVAALLEM